MIAPSTDIILYKSDLELDNTNQLKFNTWNDQWAYFSKLPHIYLDNATYQRKEGVIRFPTQDISFDELVRYNYVSYKNEAYANKTFFAYVKNMRYVNDGMTEIEIETDPYQTWQFDLIYRRCFVEREHVSNDSVGLHTIPENLELGEYILAQDPISMSWSGTHGTGSHDWGLCVAITGSQGRSVNNMYTGLSYRFFKYISGEGEAWALLNLYISDELSGMDDIIQAIFPYPVDMLDSYIDWTQTIGSTGFHYGFLKNNSWKTDAFDCGLYNPEFVSRNGTADNPYNPINNKLKIYPYRYLMVTNNNGGNIIYRFEDFTNNNPSFQLYGALVPGLSILSVPCNYKGTQYNYSESLVGAKVPLASWSSDMYTNWLVQNGVNENLASTTSYEDAKMNYNIGQVPLIGGLASKYLGIVNSMAEVWQHKVVPYGSRGNLNGGDINFSLSNIDYKAYNFTIKREYAQIIDRYFNMYGYKVNNVKVPEIHSRKNWNFIKTIDCNFSGDIPGDDLVKLRQMFDNGITLWHNPNTFLDYSQSNYII